MYGNFKIIENKIILTSKGRLCETPEELINSELFREILSRFTAHLEKKKSILLKMKKNGHFSDEDISVLIKVLLQLTKNEISVVPGIVPDSDEYLNNPQMLNDFVEQLYNFWRDYERYVICDSEGDSLHKRPYRTFNETIDRLTNVVRKTYREVQENISGTHPRIYRQVEAGAKFGAISVPKNIPYPSGSYEKLRDMPIIRHILMNPPLILDPPMNKRTGKFVKINTNPLDVVELDPSDWLCYPVKAGDLIIHVYFHYKFAELGFSLCNLFEIADEEDMKKKPDGLYLYGVPGGAIDSLSELPTVFYEDEENGIFVGACPNDAKFGYFGYLKKMILTLHNSKKMKTGKMPFHGALVRLYLDNEKEATILFIGDSGAGKSETLEALRALETSKIRDIKIIADDMGSLEIAGNGEIIGYGTETGAFLRIDDLKDGYAFGQIDRSIIMNASMVNARIIMPVTSFENVIMGHKIDFVLYANNYEEIDEDHPVIEKFDSAEKARSVFREGTVMSKGTTTSTGIVHSYYANVFGPPQYKELHDTIAERYFDAMFKKGIFVGQMRTRLGIPGWEMNGPGESAKALIELVCGDK